MLLELTKIQPGRIDVVDSSQLSPLDKLAQRSDSRVVNESVSHHEDALSIFGKAHEVERLGEGSGQRFLDEDMLACQQRVPSQLVMRVDRSGHNYAVDVCFE